MLLGDDPVGRPWWVHGIDPLTTSPRGCRPARLSFSEVTNTLRQIAAAVVGAIDKVRPDRASLLFGLDLAVKSGKLTGLLAEETSRRP